VVAVWLKVKGLRGANIRDELIIAQKAESAAAFEATPLLAQPDVPVAE
jgi:hypothetical protein